MYVKLQMIKSIMFIYCYYVKSFWSRVTLLIYKSLYIILKGALDKYNIYLFISFISVVLYRI